MDHHACFLNDSILAHWHFWEWAGGQRCRSHIWTRGPQITFAVLIFIIAKICIHSFACLEDWMIVYWIIYKSLQRQHSLFHNLKSVSTSCYRGMLGNQQNKTKQPNKINPWSTTTKPLCVYFFRRKPQKPGSSHDGEDQMPLPTQELTHLVLKSAKLPPPCISRGVSSEHCSSKLQNKGPSPPLQQTAQV